MNQGTAIHTKERKVSELNFFFLLKSRSSIQLFVEVGGGRLCLREELNSEKDFYVTIVRMDKNKILKRVE